MSTGITNTQAVRALTHGESNNSAHPAPAVAVPFKNLAHLIHDAISRNQREAFDFSSARVFLQDASALKAKHEGHTSLIMLVDSLRYSTPFAESCSAFARELIPVLGHTKVSLDQLDDKDARYAFGLGLWGNREETALYRAIDLSSQTMRGGRSAWVIAQELIAYGANLEAMNENGCTALMGVLHHSAQSFGDQEILDTLLRQGACLGAQYSNADSVNTLRWISADPYYRAKNRYFDGVLTKFEAERQAAMHESTLLPCVLQNLVINYLDGEDPWPLAAKLNARIAVASDFGLRPKIRKIVVDYCVERHENLEQPSKKQIRKCIEEGWTSGDDDNAPVNMPTPRESVGSAPDSSDDELENG